MRFRKLAGWIADRIRPALATRVERAAFLAKADLDTQMVGEFAELQGIMGSALPEIRAFSLPEALSDTEVS